MSPKRHRNHSAEVLLSILCAAFIASVNCQAPNRPANICSGLPAGVSVRNTQNCGTYYSCQNGLPILTPCPSGQLFNHITRRCDADRENVECFQCPPTAAGLDLTDVRVPNECQQFVRCSGNRTEQRTCANGLRFDRRLGQCNVEERVQCEFEVECPRRTARPMFTRHPGDCAK